MGCSKNLKKKASFYGLLAACVRQRYKQYIAGALTSYLHHKEFYVSHFPNIESQASSNK